MQALFFRVAKLLLVERESLVDDVIDAVNLLSHASPATGSRPKHPCAQLVDLFHTSQAPRHSAPASAGNASRTVRSKVFGSTNAVHGGRVAGDRHVPDPVPGWTRSTCCCCNHAFDTTFSVTSLAISTPELSPSSGCMQVLNYGFCRFAGVCRVQNLRMGGEATAIQVHAKEERLFHEASQQAGFESCYAQAYRG